MKAGRYIVTLVFAYAVFDSVSSAEAAAFSDVREDYWAVDEIEFLADEGIIKGYDDDTFRPNQSVKRSQAASMIIKALNLETDGRPDPPFTDISPSFSGYEHAATVYDEGIITGRNGEYIGNAKMTRGQMALILDRSFDYNRAEAANDFRDVREGTTFYPAVQTIAAAGVTTGYTEDNTFRPNNDTTRAQFSVFVARTLNDSFKEGEGIGTEESYDDPAAQLAVDSIGENSENYITSEFVQYVFEEAKGVSLPRYAREQQSIGTAVEREDLRAGDVVFFQGTYLMSGIYIGDSRFVIVTSDGISERNMDTSDYWSDAYVGAKKYTEDNLGPAPTDNEIVEEARDLLGSPYNSEGEDPENGFNSGSLVHYVYQEVTGSLLSKKPAGLYDAGEKISEDELQPGDLVFFQDSYLNAGIYTGDRQFIISTPSNDVVEQHLDHHTYYADRYEGAVRYSDELLSKSNPDTYADHENPVIREAMKYMGTPYLMTGSTLDAFDCSFLIQTAFRNSSGVYLPRISYKQWEVGETILDAGTDINSIELDNQLQPGDVLYFSGTWQEGISHTAIYLGDDHFAHATGEEGETTISYMNDYWKEHFTGAKRFDDLSINYDNEAVYEAYQLIGTDYELGGASPEEGFDTGGLTQYIYKQGLNIDLPRYGQKQWQEGREISRDEMERGDLMFFEGSSIIPAVYIGNNQMIVATQSSGVAIVDLTTSSYWPSRYLGSRTYDQPQEENEEALLAEDYEGDSYEGSSAEFIQQIFEEGSGIELPSSTETLRESGEEIHIEELEQGDLMFFADEDGGDAAELAGLYLGEGRFAAVIDGQVVIEEMSTDEEWIERLLEGRRISE
ncbi:NlpC/P60 family protein [Alteribacillus sp. HJP-4]|uniref:NlpC/P60 family protein n=1 Tax=Alteribacillus sp. HJP-4 TaxID=2775394 RepID=UPI0035CCCAEE